MIWCAVGIIGAIGCGWFVDARTAGADLIGRALGVVAALRGLCVRLAGAVRAIGVKRACRIGDCIVDASHRDAVVAVWV